MNTRDILHLTACSDLRRNILISMIEQDKSLGDLRKGLNISSTTVLHALKELEKNNLTFQHKNKNYALTNIGRIITLKLVDFSNAAEVMRKHERFWLEHDISGIPDHLMEKIGKLKNSFIEKAPSTNIFKVYSTFIEILKSGTEIRGISSVFAPDYPSTFKELILNKKIDTKLVLTEEVMSRIDKETVNEIYNDKDKKLEIYISEPNIKIGFMSTDSALSLGFYDHQGIYDWNQDLISYDKDAIAWGYELFEYYAKKSKMIHL